MSSTISFYLILSCLVAVITLAVSYKSGHLIKSLSLTATSGIGALFAVNILSYFSGVSIALNYISLSVSGILGIPGVIMLLFIH